MVQSDKAYQFRLHWTGNLSGHPGVESEIITFSPC